jgi:tetratricopeptide (TPR) repeat protein
MRTTLIVAVALSVALVVVGPAPAGAYFTSDWTPNPFDIVPAFPEFQKQLQGARSIPLVASESDPTSTRSKYKQRVKALEEKAKTGKLTVDDRIDLSACFYYLRQDEDAERALGPALAEQPTNFLALANLSAASQSTDLTRAAGHLQDALKNWPEKYGNFSDKALAWYHRAEGYQLKLLRSRAQEARAGVPGKEAETLDPLFPDVRFVGAGGKYEPGRIAYDEMDKLPSDALSIVQQLVLWQPFDDRLYWLLAEVYNANGEVWTACEIMDELAWVRKYAPPELKEHRRILLSVKEKNPWPERMAQGISPTAGGDPPKQSLPLSPPDTITDVMQHLPQLGVSFAVGVLMTLITVWQLRVSRDRRKGVAG